MNKKKKTGLKYFKNKSIKHAENYTDESVCLKTL